MNRHERYLKNYPKRIGEARQHRRRTVMFRKRQGIWAKANLRNVLGHYFKNHPPIQATAKEKKSGFLSRLFKPSV